MSSRRRRLVLAGSSCAIVVLTLLLLRLEYSRRFRSAIESGRRASVVGMALEAYAVDHAGSLPPILESVAPGVVLVAEGAAAGKVECPAWPPVTPVAVLRPFLERYVGRFPLSDAWGYPLRYAVSADYRHYVVLSVGSDGEVDEVFSDDWTVWDSGRDIVFIDGSFRSFLAGRTH